METGEDFGFLRWWALFWDKNAKWENFSYGNGDGVLGFVWNCVRRMVMVVGDEEMEEKRRESREKEKQSNEEGEDIVDESMKCLI